jgi:hypothetical protein
MKDLEALVKGVYAARKERLVVSQHRHEIGGISRKRRSLVR